MQYAMTAFLLGIVLGCDGTEDPAAARRKAYERFVERRENYIAEHDALFRKLEGAGGHVLVYASGKAFDQVGVSVSFKGSADVDSDVLATIAKIEEVEALDLRGINVVDEDLKILKELSMLKLIDVDDIAITDASLKNLVALPKLETLSLDMTLVTDAGMSTLKRISRLRILSLSGTAITDDGLKEIKELKMLKRLRLSGTGITDAGLRHLEGLSQLVHLDLVETNVSEDAVNRLKTAIPKCEIVTEAEPAVSE